jgi:hypothetical protein
MRSLLTIAIFGVVLAIGAGFFLWRAVREPYKGYSEPKKRVEIRRGLRTAAILQQLQKEGVLRDEWIPLVYMKALRGRDSLKAGVYEFDKPLAPVDVIDKLARGDVILASITIREGLDRFAIGKLFAAEGFGTEAEWKKITGEPDLVRDIAPDAESLEGYLFPDTYKFDPGTPVTTIVRAMVANFRKHWGEEMAFITTGLSPHQTVTLASIVETEAQLPQERPIVASVYVNRVLRPGAAVLIRGSFPGRHEQITLFRYFPGASHVASTFPTVEATIAAFEAAGFAFQSLGAVPQASAPSLAAFAEGVRLRRHADTTLAPLSEDEIAAGLRAIDADAAAVPPAPVIDYLDLLVFK